MLPKQIGITGGIGAGKTLICQVFQILGVPVYNADDRARWLMTHHSGLVEEVKSKFGKEAYFPDGALDRSYLAQRTFTDQAQVDALNQLVHPKVADDFTAWVDDQEDTPYVIKEAALLFESGSYKSLDQIVVVSAPKELRIQRVVERDPLRGEDQIRAILKRQISEVELHAKADHIIYNDETKLVLPQVLELHKKFIKT
ncbi:MAG: dephospho-CoA kinase [Cyclobacteriaceae bacterium]